MKRISIFILYKIIIKLDCLEIFVEGHEVS